MREAIFASDITTTFTLVLVYVLSVVPFSLSLFVLAILKVLIKRYRSYLEIQILTLRGDHLISLRLKPFSRNQTLSTNECSCLG
jgi:hypothetical protein